MDELSLFGLKPIHLFTEISMEAKWQQNIPEELLGRFYVFVTDNIPPVLGWPTAVGTLLDLCRVIIKQMQVEETLSAHTSRPGSVFNAETVRLTTKNIVCYSNHTGVHVIGQVANPRFLIILIIGYENIWSKLVYIKLSCTISSNSAQF